MSDNDNDLRQPRQDKVVPSTTSDHTTPKADLSQSPEKAEDLVMVVALHEIVFAINQLTDAVRDVGMSITMAKGRP